MEKIYVAADSGGSKTTWAIITSNGDEKFKFNTEGMGAAKEGMLPVLDTVIKAASKIKLYGVPESIYLSLGGPNVDEVSNALNTVWKNVGIKVEREACGNAILYAASFFGCSSVVMCGTGSTAMGRNRHGLVFSGGWGPGYGDGGSGGGMGAQALKAFLRHIDGMEDIGGIASLFDNLTVGIDIRNFEGRMELKKRALNMSRKELASLAPQIYGLAQKGDITAKKLYASAAVEIALMAKNISDDDREYKVLLCGGFFANKPEFVNDCKRRFKKMSNAQMCYNESFGPIIAAEAAVLRDNSIEVTKEMFDKILKGDKL